MLRDLKRNSRLQESEEFQRGTHSLAWGLHAKALNAWYQSLERKPSFVWCSRTTWASPVPRDAGGYCETRLRRRGPRDGGREIAALGAWWWLDVHSTAFAERYGDDVYISREHVQRFSMRLLDRLHAAEFTKSDVLERACPDDRARRHGGRSRSCMTRRMEAHDGPVTAHVLFLDHVTASHAGRRADRRTTRCVPHFL